MKRLFYFCFLLLIVFEISNVYFIMPFPGSQGLNSLDFAYFLYSWRWFFRFAIGIGVIMSTKNAFDTKRKFIPIGVLVITSAVVYVTNFKLNAEAHFRQPEHLIFKNYDENAVPLDRLIIGVRHNNEIKAYPIAFLAYHHQVFDYISGEPVLVTYCDVCRSGRVFEPRTKGKLEHFRLVGMNHFNAMFEDKSTKSWWRQESGKAVTGELKGEQLPEILSQQMSLTKWLELYPDSKIMQADPSFKGKYDDKGFFEKGLDKDELTKTSSTEWSEKSWVIGVEINGKAKAYSWQKLKSKSIINDRIDGVKIIVALSSDNNSFVVLENPTVHNAIILSDEIILGDGNYDFSGRGINAAKNLKTIPAYQEFWHSWLQFHPNTLKYK